MHTNAVRHLFLPRLLSGFPVPSAEEGARLISHLPGTGQADARTPRACVLRARCRSCAFTQSFARAPWTALAVHSTRGSPAVPIQGAPPQECLCVLSTEQGCECRLLSPGQDGAVRVKEGGASAVTSGRVPAPPSSSHSRHRPITPLTLKCLGRGAGSTLLPAEEVTRTIRKSLPSDSPCPTCT